MLGTTLAPRRTTSTHKLIGALILLATLAFGARADQVEMQNGDRYAGIVVSLNADTLTLKSQVLGVLKLPRDKVSLVALGNRTLTNSVTTKPEVEVTVGGASPGATNLLPVLPPALTQAGANTNASRQSVMQLLNDAGPEAKTKFNELMGGFLSGKLSVDDIRGQAQSAADQLRALKTELGPDAGLALDGYLSILDHFLGQGSSGAPAAPKSADARAKPKTAPGADEE